ncbi:sugar O-acetyltransferase [Pseudovibrio exalbescens]|nr:sugar O-acetyltransferase [Pseudovibrio exalbescens]MDD7910929.1 sugar O-acetyltransferase [Pseudovibrio exalbescens]
MMHSERQKMAAGEWYCCLDDELDGLRRRAHEAVHEHCTLPPQERGFISPKLRALLGSSTDSTLIESPFHCSYGFNIHLGAQVYLNAGCTILDSAPVRIGDQTMLGPNVQIYCAQHHKDPEKRVAGLEIAKPVTIGSRVWIGGAAVIMPGVSIGDEAIVGAGAVVTKDVAEGATVVGNPARPLPCAQ